MSLSFSAGHNRGQEDISNDLQLEGVIGADTEFRADGHGQEPVRVNNGDFGDYEGDLREERHDFVADEIPEDKAEAEKQRFERVQQPG